jgi:hypothetical protein
VESASFKDRAGFGLACLVLRAQSVNDAGIFHPKLVLLWSTPPFAAAAIRWLAFNHFQLLQLQAEIWRAAKFFIQLTLDLTWPIQILELQVFQFHFTVRFI